MSCGRHPGAPTAVYLLRDDLVEEWCSACDREAALEEQGYFVDEEAS